MGLAAQRLQEDPWPSIWDILIEQIGRGSVIPVIGPELAVINVDGEDWTVDQFVARQLAIRIGMRPGLDVDGDGRFTLNDVVAYKLKSGSRETLYADINAILNSPHIRPSESLTKLAQITDFKLYVTLTYDKLIHQALVSAGRGSADTIPSIGYVGNRMPGCDLPKPVRQLTLPVVYHLLGRQSPLPEFVISDDDLLEYIIDLQSERTPRVLFEELKTHSLLFLGGTLPDWLLRMVLRVTKQQRLSSPRLTAGAIEVLADSHSRSSESLCAFLGDFSPQTKVFATDAHDFIDELWVRWKGVGRRAVDPQTKRFVFLSYSREDFASAQRVASLLAAANVNVWFDDAKFAGGERVWTEINKQIKDCTIFMPLISATTEQRTRDANFRREWAMAIDRNLGNADSVRFLMPVIVDDLQVRQMREVPPEILAAQARTFPGGVLDQQYVDLIANVLKAGT